MRARGKMEAMAYDAFLLVSFGGPEGPDDVLPFLRNVTRGRGVPDDRLAEVARTTSTSAGCRRSTSSAATCSPRSGRAWSTPASTCRSTGATGTGSRMLADTVGRMRDDGIAPRPRVRDQPVRLVLVVPPVPRRHRGRPGRASEPDAPVIDKIRHYHDHPGHIAAARRRGRRGAGDACRRSDGRRTRLVVHRPLDPDVAWRRPAGPGGGTDRYRSQLRGKSHPS